MLKLPHTCYNALARECIKGRILEIGPRPVPGVLPYPPAYSALPCELDYSGPVQENPVREAVACLGEVVAYKVVLASQIEPIARSPHTRGGDWETGSKILRLDKFTPHTRG